MSCKTTGPVCDGPRAAAGTPTRSETPTSLNPRAASQVGRVWQASQQLPTFPENLLPMLRHPKHWQLSLSQGHTGSLPGKTRSGHQHSGGNSFNAWYLCHCHVREGGSRKRRSRASEDSAEVKHNYPLISRQGLAVHVHRGFPQRTACLKLCTVGTLQSTLTCLSLSFFI